MTRTVQPGYILSSVKAVGSCYLTRQSPGSENIGGLQVSLITHSRTPGLEVTLTDRAGTPIGEDIGWLTETATRAVQDYAKEHHLDFSGCKIEVSHFLYHPVDSSSGVFYQAAQSALRSALEALEFSRS
jgi:hypothetical protein